jgi:macrolide transport system ATP-binding/permease protein
MGRILRDLGDDLGYALRQYAREPGVTVVLLLTMALGIGANVGVFSILNGLLRPLPVRSPEQLVVIAADTKGDETGLRFRFSYAALEDFRNQADKFSEVFAYSPRLGGFTFGEKTTQFMYSAVTGNYFSALGVKPAAGRLLAPGEGENEGAPRVVVLGHSFWQRRFGADPNIVGQQVRIDGRSAIVIGVTSKDFRGVYEGLDMEGYVPLRSLAEERWAHQIFTKRDVRPFTVLGRLKPAVSVNEAQSEMNVLMRRLEAQYPGTDKGTGARVVPEPLARPIPLRTAMEMFPFIRFSLLFLAALVLGVACMNITNILLVRATVREREMAIRAALGSGRGRLIRQMLTESVLLALLGGVAGMIIGNWASKAFADALPRMVSDLPVVFDASFDWRVFTYALLAALLAGALIGIWPALRVSRTEPGSALHDGSRTNSSGPRRQRMRGLLVAGQVAGSLILLVAAGLFVRSLQGAQRLDLGYAPDHLLNARMDPQWVGYDEQRTVDFYRELERRVKAWPEVQSAGLAFSAPLGLIGSGETIYIEGRAIDPGEQPPSVGYNTVDASYFDAMRIPILRGRAFRESDTETAPLVAIVNETMAKRYWPNQDPIGKRFRMESPESPLVQVVGVAHDSKYLFVVEGSLPYFYVPFMQLFSAMRVLHVRTLVDPQSLATRVQQEVSALDPVMPVSLQTMSAAVDGAQGFFLLRVGAMQAGGMGILGLLLAGVGVYGVMSYGAAQRTREIGIRMALGATPRAVLGMILHQGVWMVLVGVLVGLLGAAAVTRVLGRFLFSVSLGDPLTFVGAALLLGLVALAACYLPARRAMRVEPMAALRHE